MRRLLLLLALVTGLGGATGCLSGDLTLPEGAVSGTYDLRTINGSQLPYTASNGIVITRETLTLQGDGNFTDVSQYSNGQSLPRAGVYTRFGNVITFTEITSNGSQFQYQGSLSGTVLTQFVNGFTQVFQKQ